MKSAMKTSAIDKLLTVKTDLVTPTDAMNICSREIILS